MKALINQIAERFSINEEEAKQVVNFVRNYKPASETEIKNNTKPNVAISETETQEESMFEKATHFVEGHLPSGIKEKAEEMIGGYGDKLKGMFK